MTYLKGVIQLRVENQQAQSEPIYEELSSQRIEIGIAA